jgi:hypothetical protein
LCFLAGRFDEEKFSKGRLTGSKHDETRGSESEETEGERKKENRRSKRKQKKKADGVKTQCCRNKLGSEEWKEREERERDFVFVYFG